MAADSQKAPPQPRDARIVSLILQSLGVEDYDPKVVHQLLEFAHSKYYIFMLYFVLDRFKKVVSI